MRRLKSFLMISHSRVLWSTRSSHTVTSSIVLTYLCKQRFPHRQLKIMRNIITSIENLFDTYIIIVRTTSRHCCAVTFT